MQEIIYGGVSFIGEPRKFNTTNREGREVTRTAVNISIAVARRQLNRDTNQWEDTDKFYVDCSLFDRLADNALASLHLGDRVFGVGRRQYKKPWTDKNGVEHKNDTQVVLDYLGPDLNMWPWQVNRPDRAAGSSSAPASRPAPAKHQATAKAPAAKTPVTSAPADDPFGDLDIGKEFEAGSDPWGD